jgi:hypothetical protein
MVQQTTELDGLIDEQYVPSSVERKKAVLMYFFVGIVAALSKKRLSIYELFHLKQSLGWWMIFFVMLIMLVPFRFIPRFWIVPVVFFLCYLVVRIIFTKQAREGNYMIDEDKIFLPLFAGIG